MKKIIAAVVLTAFGALMLPLAADAQVYRTQRVYRDGRRQTIRVYEPSRTQRYYGTYNNRRSGRITPQEQRRLARERSRYSRLANRSTRDGYISGKEARKLNKRANKYRRDVYRSRNN